MCPTSGAISLNILTYGWTPALTLHGILISLQSLLHSPELDDPLDAQVAEHYETSKQSFDDTARYWTLVYAGGPLQIDEIAIAGLERVHVRKFEGFGFERPKVVRIQPTRDFTLTVSPWTDRGPPKTELPRRKRSKYIRRPSRGRAVEVTPCRHTLSRHVHLL